MPFVKREYEYYKYSNEINAAIIGSFSCIDNKVASGFSASNYLVYPKAFTPSTQTWEKVFKYTPTSTTIDGTIYSHGTVDKCGDSLVIDGTKPRLLIGYKASDWNIDKTASYTLLPNTSYWFKVSFTGASYTVDVSTDGVVYENIISVSSSTAITANMSQLNIGQRLGYSWPLTYGAIDLKESYIKINGELWWSGNEYTRVGSWIDDGVVSGTSASKYLEVTNSFDVSGGKTWDMVYKVTTGSDVTSTQSICGHESTTTNFDPIVIAVVNSQFAFDFANSSTSNIVANKYSSVTVEANKTYYLKVSFTGSEYVFNYSFDGVDYIEDFRVSSSTSIWTSNLILGRQEAGTSSMYPWLGSIDLNESYIKINDKLWWNGVKAYQVNLDGEDVYGEWVQPVLTSNGTLGGNKFAAFASSQYDSNYPAWHVFDKDTSNEWEPVNSGGIPGFIGFYNPRKLKVSKLDILNGNQAYVTKATLQGSNNNFNWDNIQEITNSSGTLTDWSVDISGDRGYLYHRLYITETSNKSYCDIRSINITAQELKQVSSNDYDYSIPRNKLYQLSKPKRTYYKYGTEINANVVGSFGRITDGVAGGFKVGTLLQTPDIIDTSSNTWERVVKITTGNDVSSGQSIWGTIPDYKGLLLRLANGKLYFYVSSSGTSWNVVNGATSSLTLLGVRDYYIKTSFNGSQYLVDVSTNGVDYTNYITVASSTNTIPGKISIGGHGVSETLFDTPFFGSVDISKSYIKVGDETVWDGTNYTKVGSWIDKGVVSGFTTSNYLVLDNKYKSTDNVEYVFKFTTGSDVTTTQCVVHSEYLIYLEIYNGELGSYSAGQQKNNFIFNPTPSTTYWVKTIINGTNRLVSYSEDGVNYVGETIVSDTGMDSNNTSHQFRLGISSYNSKNPFLGSIDLNESYININGKRWWHGTKAYGVNLGGEDVYGEWKQPILSSNNSSSILKVSATNEGQGEAWKAFDGNNQTHWCTANNTPAGTLTAIVDEDIYITSIEVTGLSNQHGYTNTITIYSDQNKQNIIGEQKTFNYSESDSLVWNFEEPVKANILVFDVTGSNWVCVMNIKITAQELKVAGSDTYDYYIDRLLSYSPLSRTGEGYVTFFESSEGGDYEVVIPEDVKARVSVVGGGGAAAILGRYDDRGYGWSGGSGGAFIGEVLLSAGKYNITVGSANNNTKPQGGNTNTINPDDTSTHDSYITGVVRVGGGGAGTTSGVGAAGLAPVLEVEPLNIELNSAGNAGAYGAGGKGSGANATMYGGASVYKGHGQGQGCSVSEYAGRRYWINGTNGYVRIEVWSKTKIRSY